MTPPPAHAGKLDATLAEALRLLSRGVADRRHAFHTPSLASIGQDGTPLARTVVLRGFDAAARTLRFHTDARSAKVGEFAADPRCALHLYDATAQIQLRLAGQIAIHGQDALADTAWAASRPMSRVIYALPPDAGPGTPLGAPLPAPTDPEAGRPYFRVLVMRMTHLEWLWLAASGHQRAAFAWDDTGALSSSWLVP